MIILCYDGVGKTTLAGKYKFVELDDFDFLDSNGDLDTYNYLRIAQLLENQGFNVLLYPHPDIIKIIKSHTTLQTDFCIIYPSLDLKDLWLKKLYNRVKNFLLVDSPITYKYFKIKNNYTNDIQTFKSLKIKQLQIDNMDYNLANMLINI